jgi:PAS domain S-box-containing protein
VARDSGSETILEHLLESARDMVYRVRIVPTFRFEFLGGAVAAITGRSREDLLENPRGVLAAVHPGDAGLVERLMTDPAEVQRRLRRTLVIRWVHPGGTVVWAEHRRVPVFNASGRLVAVAGIARDITDRVETQRRLRRSQQQLRRLAAKVDTAREEQRTAIARELHDELGQNLTAIKIEMERTVGLFRRDQLEPKAVDRLQSLVGLIELGIAAVKRMATDLRPPTLDYLGLAEAIEWEASEFRTRTGIRCRVAANAGGRNLSTDQQTVVFRIFQEALTNIARHAKASAVDVTLAERDGVFELKVQDNGRGITLNNLRDPRAIGLLGMRERAALIGGTCRVSGRRGRGTLVAVRVRLPADHSTRAARGARGPRQRTS